MNNVYINPIDNYGKAILEQNKIEFEAQMKEITSNKINTMQEKIKKQKKLLKEREQEIIKLKTLLSNICYELEGIVRTTERIGITKNTGYVLSQHNIDLIKKIILKIDEENKEC